MFLTKEQILQKQDVKTEEVEVPEWGGKVIIAEMTGFLRDRWENLVFTDKGEVQDFTYIREKTLICSIVDEELNPIFTEEDIPELAKKNGVILNRLFLKAREISA